MRAITRRRGDTFAEVFQFVSETTNQPIDLDDCTFLLTVSTVEFPTDDDDQVFQIEGAVLDAPTAKVEFPPSDEDADNVGAFYFDVQITDAAGRIRTAEVGTWTVKQDITKTE